MFLDPTASHLIITTTLSENFYLHTQSRQPKALSRLRGVPIESVSWNPSRPTASTREILVGASDGNLYEVYIEPSTEFYRREEKYLKTVYKSQSGPITGIWADAIPGSPEIRRVMVATPAQLLHFAGRTSRQGTEGGGSIYTKLFEVEAPTVHALPTPPGPGPSSLTVSPDPSDHTAPDREKAYAWLSSHGVFHGKLLTSSDSSDLGRRVFSDSRMLMRAQITPGQSAAGRQKSSQEPITSIALTQWHVLTLVQGKVVAVNQLDDSIVYEQHVLEAGEKAIGLVADQVKNTFWLFTTHSIYEIVVTDESRDVWKIMLKRQQFDAASQYATTPAQKDAVATASGDYLVSKGQYLEAAAVYGRSTKPFEHVALTFIHHGNQDALRNYLLTKLAMLKRTSVMQRIMVATWIVELYMTALNALEDTITTKAELSESMNTSESQDQLSVTRRKYQDFVSKHKSDLDIKTIYEIISSHGREEELLYFATVVNDYSFVMAYWVQRERWPETLTVLKKQTDPEIFYKYSSVLMAHVPVEFVDIIMRQDNLDAKRLIPAFLNYNNITRVPLSQVLFG